MEGLELEQAIEILLANIDAINDVEEIPLLESVGRVVAENYFAHCDNPPFNRSPLDGYAVNSADTPNNFKVVGEECAGDFFTETLQHGEALRIMTGAAIPNGADCVIRQEDIIKVDAENIFIPKKLNHYENFCFAGEDVKRGTLLIKKDTKITAPNIAILASQGLPKVKVYQRPRIVIASTGDELLELGEKLFFGKIYNNNEYLLRARLSELGFISKSLKILPDSGAEAVEKISAIKNEVDLLITTGGVSVGKKDIMHDVVKRLGERICWRVRLKPGSPVIGWRTENFLGLALSGNPFAAYATFELLARPIIAKLSRRADILYTRTEGILENDFPKKSRGRRFIRAKIVDGKIYLPQRHESGNLFSAIDCNCLVDIPAGSDELSAGTKVEVVLL